MTPTLLSVALLLLLPWVSAADVTNFTILVTNTVTHAATETYSTHVVYRGILLGGLKRLQDSNVGFKFTYTENPDYGPFLDSVNDLAGNTNNRTYWELLVKQSDQVFRPDVGIGCYIPSANDTIILNYSRY